VWAVVGHLSKSTAVVTPGGHADVGAPLAANAGPGPVVEEGF